MSLLIKILAISWLIASSLWFYTGNYQTSQIPSLKESIIKTCQNDSNQNRPYEDTDIVARIIKFHTTMNQTKFGTPEYLSPAIAELQAKVWFIDRHKDYGYFQSFVLPNNTEIFNNNYLLKKEKDENVPPEFRLLLERERAVKFFKLTNGKSQTYINADKVLDVPPDLFMAPTYYVYKNSQIKKMSDDVRLKISSDVLKLEETYENIKKYWKINKYLGYYAIFSFILTVVLLIFSKINFKKKAEEVKNWQEKREHDKLRAVVEAEIKREQEKLKIRQEILKDSESKK